MAVLVPGTTTGFNLTSYKRGAQEATYQKMVAIPIIEDYGQRIYGTGAIRKWARVASSVLTQTAAGTGLDTATVIGSAATLTAAGNYVHVQWSRNEQAQIDIDLNSGALPQIEQALAEGSDQSVLTSVASLTQNVSQASIDGPLWRQVVGRLMGNTNGVSIPGGKTIYGIFSHTQYPNLGSIPEFNNAEIRGDSENPYVKGIWTKGGGVLLNFSTVVQADANGWHNVVFIADCFTIGWNTRHDVDMMKDELAHRLIVFNNFGAGISRDLGGIDVRTTASAL